MTKVNYQGKEFNTTSVVIDGYENVYGEIALMESIEDYNDIGCDLDNVICYYPENNDLIQLDKLRNDENKAKEYCNKHDIYYVGCELLKMIKH